VERGDVERPAFHAAEDAHRKMFADNPDTDYLRAPIRLGPGRAYRVFGRVPKGTLYAQVLLYGRGGRVGQMLRDEQLRPEGDGRFELRISTEEQPGTWLKGDGDETAVMVRQYFADRRTEPPLEVHIERLGPIDPAPPLTPTELAKQISRAQRMLESVMDRTTSAYRALRSAALNRFIEVPGDRLFPTPDNRYRVAWYRFGPDQMIVVRGRRPKARYFSLCLYNAWMESLDYQHHQVSLNHQQLRTEPDGSFTVCISPRDPGVPNWLDPAGHQAGYVLCRSLLAEGEPPPLSLEVVYQREWSPSPR
jgi:hypothetical protein